MMDEFVKLPKEEQLAWINEAASRKGVTPTIIEKDYWVCWTLKEIFSINELKSILIFQGGTSLSKAHRLIERFSEDIDLTVDRAFLGISDSDIYENTRKKRDKLLQEIGSRLAIKLEVEVLPLLKTKFSESFSQLGIERNNWSIQIDLEDNQNISFYYPKVINNPIEDYIKPTIKLEFRAKGEKEPSFNAYINSYLAQVTGHFHTEKIEINTLKPERIFWEKVFILHAQHNISGDKTLSSRIMRHYYDVVMLAKHEIGREAIEDTELLCDVIRNKENCFPSKGLGYHTARVGSFRLSPPLHQIQTLKQDYQNTLEMIFGTPPTFEQLINELSMIEKVINDPERIINEFRVSGTISHDTVILCEHFINKKTAQLKYDYNKAMKQGDFRPGNLLSHHLETRNRAEIKLYEIYQSIYFPILQDLHDELSQYFNSDKRSLLQLKSLYWAMENKIYSEVLQAKHNGTRGTALTEQAFQISRQKEIEKILTKTIA